MKILNEKVVKGKRRVTVELDEGEKLMNVKPNAYYSLGYPLSEDVVYGDVLSDSCEVFWCVIEQKWVPL